MIVNLNKYRKERRRIAAERQAEENRVRFGRSKAERGVLRQERERTEKSLDDKRLD